MNNDDINQAVNNAAETLDDSYLKAKRDQISDNSFINKFKVDDSKTKLIRGLCPTEIRRPSSFEYFRTLVDMKSLFNCYMIEYQANDSKFFYMVTQDIAEKIKDELGNVVKKYYLQIAISNFGNTFVWPLKTHGLTGDKDKRNGWNCSALEASKAARKEWVKMLSNNKAQQYYIRKAPTGYPNPDWPDESYGEILDKVFRDQMINSLDHPILLECIGEDYR